MDLRKGTMTFPLADEYVRKIEAEDYQNSGTKKNVAENGEKMVEDKENIQDHRASYTESPLRPTEKRKV